MKYGFVTNIETPLNLDVDFGLNASQECRFSLDRVYSSDYTYRDVESGEFRAGKTHRVRLRGITKVNQRFNRGKHHEISVRALNELRNKVDRCGGFVIYRICGVDVFGRAIVELYDPVTQECFNDIFLKPEYSSVFTRYVRQ